MSQLRNTGSNRDLTESFLDFLSGAAKVLLWLGMLAAGVGVGFLLYYCAIFGTGSPANAVEAQAAGNVDTFGKVLLAGMVSAAVGSTFLWWGEEVLGVLQVLIAAALFFVPMYLPSVLGNGSRSPIYDRSVDAIQRGGGVFGLVAIAVLIFDMAGRVRERMSQGAKADQMKYGKGVKEERGRQNVFMGKCWQLPFCRQFVRDKCPIYHSKRTCWKELVGCMCEEQVIRDAMGGKVIPKDMVAAANYIPHNNKLSFEQKRERCKQCVIYNEHQKHKYKASLWPTLALFVAIYALGRNEFLAMTKGAIEAVSSSVKRVTFNTAKGAQTDLSVFQEILLVCFFVVVMTYAIKLLEYLFFKLKV